MHATIERTAIIALGSNEGVREDMILEAARGLDKLSAVPRFSPVFETLPLGAFDQQSYLNCVAELPWRRGSYDLLRAIQSLERELGRSRTKHWGSRRIDLDILFLTDEKYSDGSLRIPHPEIEHRSFVLLPLTSLFPEMISPNTDIPLQRHLHRCRPGGWRLRFWPPEKRRGRWTMKRIQ